MFRKRMFSLAVAVMAITMPACAQESMARFVDSLMAQMTLEEKIGQLNLVDVGDFSTGNGVKADVLAKIGRGEAGGVFNVKGLAKIRRMQEAAVKETRLGIPLLVGMDVIHGYETIFPIPLASACSWDIDAIRQSARIAAREASADGICWTFSPMVDVSTEPRWGRVAEGAGEDPWLGSRIAEAMVEGYQGKGYSLSPGQSPIGRGEVADVGDEFLPSDALLACLKHFALYGASEGGRDYNTVDMSRLRMFNQYMAPYEAAVRAGVGSVMSSFNIVDGIPATANRWLLNDLLRQQWGFGGLLVSDYGSIGEMAAHGMGDLAHNSALALRAGTDMDMCSNGFLGTLKNSLQSGLVTQKDIDQACRRVLEAKYRLGLFDDPYRFLDETRRECDILTEENRAAARKLAAESMVLLKNGGVLPLREGQTVALIGPLGDTRNNLGGTWCPSQAADRYQTLREALQERIGEERALFAQGCNISADAALQTAAEFGKTIPRIDAKAGMEEALAVARRADVVLCAMGECADMSGESSSRTDLDLPSEQRELLSRLLTLGKPLVLLHFSGRPTTLGWEAERVPAILQVWFPGSEGGRAICDVVLGDVCPSGKLTMTFPKRVGQIPIYYNCLPTGRDVAADAPQYYKYQSNYLDLRNGPLYPFGYGLSYTTFAYGQPVLSAASMSRNGGSVTVSVDVTNTGERDGDEVVQLYIHARAASVSRPVKELKGFQRIHLKAGERQTVSFVLTPDLLSYRDANGQPLLDPSTFDIMVGGNSRDVKGVQLTIN